MICARQKQTPTLAGHCGHMICVDCYLAQDDKYECPVCKKCIFNRYLVHVSTQDELFETDYMNNTVVLPQDCNDTNRKYEIFKLDHAGTVVQRNNFLFSETTVNSEYCCDVVRNTLMTSASGFTITTNHDDFIQNLKSRNQKLESKIEKYRQMAKENKKLKRKLKKVRKNNKKCLKAIMKYCK